MGDRFRRQGTARRAHHSRYRPAGSAAHRPVRARSPLPARAMRGDDIVLTNAAYDALGTLNGAIETAAEAALAPLGPAAAAALPRLLRSLVTSAASAAGARAATPALRQAPLDAVAHDQSSKRLVRTLVDARILVSGRD